MTRNHWTFVGAWFMAALLLPHAIPAQPPGRTDASPSPSHENAESPDADESRFRKLADRYRLILERNPRRGTAFDLWYRHYVDAGRLDQLVESVETQAREQSDSAAAQILRGLVYERMGESERAVRAFAAAERLNPENYYPSAARGTTLVRLQDWEAAGQALARALTLNPPRVEELEIRKQLGRIQLRQGRIEDALKTFEETAEAFPDDGRVLQELAELLTQERQYDAAIRHWEQLVALSGDDLYARSKARTAIAQLHADAGRHNMAVRFFDRVLDDVDPESWLAADIRRRIESVYRRSGNGNGWLVYCRDRLERHPQELSTMLELGRAWSKAGQSKKALEQFQAVVKLAPSRKDARELLIDTLVADRRFSEAIEQCEELAQQHPQDVEALRRLGRLHLEAATDANRPEAEKQAAKAFERIAAIRPDDAALAVQAAEACRNEIRLLEFRVPADQREQPVDLQALLQQSPLLAAAWNNYREAVRRAPDAITNREYLAEFLHALGCHVEVKKILTEIVTPPNDTADRWFRVAELSARFDFRKNAVAAARESLQRQPDVFARREFLIEMLVQSGELSEVETELAALERLAADRFQVRKALHKRVETYKAAGWLDREIQRRMEADSKPTTNELWLLGLLLAERWRHPEAVERFQAALTRSPKNIELHRDYVQLLEQSGNGAAAIDVYRKLAEWEPQRRVAHFQKIVELELRLGKNEAAQKDVERLLQLAGSNADGYRLQSEVAFRLGNASRGLEALRHAVRIAPRDLDIRLQLAQKLMETNRKTEGREHYWRCFELANGLDEQLMTVAALCNAANSTRERETLIDRLRRLQQQADDPKNLTLCLVEALRIFKKPGEARRELAQLSATAPDDQDVLARLVALAEAARDWKAAASYQERLVDQDPRKDHLVQLARLHTQNGDPEAALRVRKRILIESGSEAEMIDVIDNLLRTGQFDQAVDLTQWSLERKAASWPLQFRLGMGRFLQGEAAKAAEEFEAVGAIREFPQDSASQSDGTRASRTEPSLEAVYQQQMTRSGRTLQSPQFVTVNRQGQVVSLQSTKAIHSIPEVYEISIAHSFWMHLQLLREVAGKNPVTRRSRIASSVAQRLVRGLQMPESLEEARIESVVASYAIAFWDGKRDDWMVSRLERAAREPRRLREVVLAFAAAGDFAGLASLDSVLPMHLPKDPLRHLAVVYHMGSAWGNRKPRETGREDLIKSFEWFSRNRPDLRQLLLQEYATTLVRLGDRERAQTLVAEELESADSLDDVAKLAEFVALNPMGTGANYRKFLQKCARLAANAPESVATAESLDKVLGFAAQDHLKSLTTEAGADALVTLFHRYFHLPRPTAASASAGLGTASGFNPVTFRMRLQSQSQIQFTRIGRGFDTFRSPTRQAMTTATRRLGGRGNVRNTFTLLFPTPNNDLDERTLVHLGNVVAILKHSGRETDLAERLSAELSEADSLSAGERRRLSLAVGYGFWLAGDTNRALQQLATLCEEFPEDLELRVELATAYALAEKTHQALRTLDALVPAAEDEQKRISDLRNKIVALFPWSNHQEMVNVLLTELDRETRPQLTHYFTWSPPIEYRRVTMVAGRPIFGIVGHAAPPDGAFRESPLLAILDHAAKTEQIATVERHIARLSQRFPNHAELAAFRALVQFETGETAGAVEAARNWQTLAREDAEPFRGPEAPLVVIRCLETPDSRALGYELAGELFPILQSQRAGGVQQTVLATLCRALLAEDRLDEAQAAIRKYYEAMISALIPSSSSTKSTLTTTLRRAAHSARSFPPELLPVIVEMIAERAVENFEQIRNTGSLAFDLHATVENVRDELDDDSKRRLRDSFQKMLFPHGPDGIPEFYRWQRRSTAPVGTMAMLVIDLSRDFGELERLRADWDRHPSAHSLDLLVLRLEAAVAAEEFSAAETLLGELKARYGKQQVRPQVWSQWCMARLYAERQTANWVLSLGEGASIQISPGGRIDKITYLPESEFSIREIRLVGHPTLSDDGLANVARLKQIRKLVLSYSTITDAGLEHLSHLKSLHTLRLSGTKITDAGLKHLEGLTGLRELLLQGTDVTEQGVEQLRRALPDCDIEY